MSETKTNDDAAQGHVIPTIDLTPLRTGDAAARLVIEAIGRAAEIYGFMSVVGHGVPHAVVDGVFGVAPTFFGQPEEVKRQVQDRTGTDRGFQPIFDNHVAGHKPGGNEAFTMGHPRRPSDPALLELPCHAETPWPEVQGFRPALEGCYEAMFGVGQQVLAAMALHLGAPEDFFEQRLRNTYSSLRLMHYPTAESIQHVTDIGARPHEDLGLITLLIQDMNGGLEVMGPDGEWIPVAPQRDAIVVNIGGLMTHWTNGRYKSVLHKVVNRSGRERYSIPLFIHPDYRQVIDARDFASAGTAIQFEPFVAGERVYDTFARQRLSWRGVVATGERAAASTAAHAANGA